MRFLGAFLAALVVVAAGRANQAPSATQTSRAEQVYRLVNVGVGSLERFEYPFAVTQFREALKLDPANGAARLNLALALHYGGNPEAAAKEALAAAAAMPHEPRTWFVAGLAARAAGNAKEALDAFNKALELDPSDAATLVNIGQLHLEAGAADAAVQHLAKAVAAEPSNATAAYAHAMALLRGGRAAEGQEAMKRFQALRQAPYAITYGTSYLQQGPYAEAMMSTGLEPELVDPAPPVGGFTDITAELPPGAMPKAASTVTLAYVNEDNDLDLVMSGEAEVRVLLRDAKTWKSTTLAAPGRVQAVAAADYDNDGRGDLAVVSDAGVQLWHHGAGSKFEDVTARASLTSTAGGRTVAWADLDHDGDTDLLVGGAATQAWRNNGNGTFSPFAREVGLEPSVGAAVSIVPTDFDLGRDIDVLFAGTEKVALLKNMRENRFADVASQAGFPGGAYRGIAAGDLNGDGRTDFYFVRDGAAGVFALSHRTAEFRFSDGPPAASGARAAQLIDFDTDGLLDLVMLGPSGLRVLRNVATGWTPLSSTAGAPCEQRCVLASGDIDADGDTDVLTADGAQVRMWRNDASRGSTLRLRLTSRVSNRSAVGARVELRAGSLLRRFELSAASPAAAAADITFGLGRRTPDVVRVVWPSGIVQAENVTGLSADGRHRQAITELDRKPSSCPYLFTWNGTRFEFITDFLGGGEMGYWLAPGVRNVPDPEEYVRIPGEQLKARDGRYELRVTNELEEALFLDRLSLTAVTHPEGTEVYPNEGLFSAPYPSHRLFVTTNARVPDAALDEHGHDVKNLVAAIDRRSPDDFAVERLRGYAKDHFVELAVGPRQDASLLLLLTAWTDYAFSSDNVAASQAGLGLRPPSLEMLGADGQWRTVIDSIGIPVGRPQTLVVDAGKYVPLGGARLRIRTNMRVYWDRILLADAARTRATRTVIEPDAVALRWRGYSAEHSPDGKEPFGYDYARVSSDAPWKLMPGRYTREGDVGVLLAAPDDRLVVSRPGDEVALTFKALSPPPPGSTRTFLLYAVGYSKEMDTNSASPDVVGPLPYRAMTAYPYDPATRPLTPQFRDYIERFNTRVVTRPMPLLAR